MVPNKVIFVLCFLLITIAGVSKEISINPDGGNFLFIPNQKQWEDQVLYKADIPGGKLFLQNNALTYLFYDTQKLHDHHNESSQNIPVNPANKTLAAPNPGNSIQMHAVEVEFLNSNKNARVTGIGEFPTNYNYFTGDDPDQWSSGIKAVSDVVYKEIYPFTDMKVYSTSKGLKYDFILAPGATPENITLRYKGAESLYLKDKNLIVKTSLQTINEQAPIAYQLINKDTVFVTCSFLLNGNDLHFDFPQGYNKDLPLIIDPLLIFSTYSGSTADNWGFTATYDDEGNVYTAGVVFNTGFPVTTGAYQRFYGNNLDIGILKYDSTGSNLLYATYLGGSQAEAPHSLITNNLGELILFGSSSSSNFPTTSNAYQRQFNGGSEFSPLSGIDYKNGSDLILSRFNASGSQLLASTMLGGSKNDGIMIQYGTLTKNYGDQFRGDIILDDDNNVYVASHTTSVDFPLENPFQPEFGGGTRDGVVFKFSPDFSTLFWSSFLGGSGEDAAYSLKIDTEMNAIVCGGTSSDDFITTSGTLIPQLGGNIDGFVTKVNATGDAVLQSSYIGTSAYDQVYFIDLDLQDNIYLFGQTLGDYPVSQNVFSNTRGSQFIHKINKELTETVFSTVFGSGSHTINITPNAFLVNECENIFISGWGGNINSAAYSNGLSTGYLGGNTLGMPLTNDAYQRTSDGSDFYLLAFEKDAASLLYATYFGGNNVNEHVDGGTSRFDKRGIVYQAVCAGCGGSSSYPTTPGAWSNTNNSLNCNNAVFKFDMATLKAQFVTNNELLDQPGYDNGCAPLTVVFQNTSLGGKDFEWDLGDGTTSTKKDNLVHTYDTPGTYEIILKAVDGKTCKKVDYAYGTIKVFQPDFFVGDDLTICQGESIQLTANGGVAYNWWPEEGLNDPKSPTPIATPSDTTTYYVHIVDKNNCSHEDSVTVFVIPEVIADFEYEIINGCESLPVVQFTNTSIGVEEFVWDFGDGTTSTEENPVHQYQEEGSYKVSIQTAHDICSDVKEINLPLRLFFIPNVFSPNGDNVNEYFEINSNVPVNLTIFNRWGKEIYKKDDYNNKWDAEGFPSGIYYYEVKLPDNTFCKGWLQVLR